MPRRRRRGTDRGAEATSSLGQQEVLSPEDNLLPSAVVVPAVAHQPEDISEAMSPPAMAIEHLLESDDQAIALQAQAEKPAVDLEDVGVHTIMEQDLERLPTGVVYTASREHAIEHGKHIERPERVIAVMQSLQKEGLLARACEVKCREATLDELGMMHSDLYVQEMRRTTDMQSQAEVNELASSYESIYLNRSSFTCACTASGGVLELMQRVLTGTLLNGFAVVRPPGHHAEADQCCGFCIFNSVAVAAAAARAKFGVERVLIVDWDVHHGNGTQHLFEDDPTVMYFSTHRYDNGDFFPGSTDAAPNVVGRDAGEGFNINVAWNIAWKDDVGMGDDEYLAAWQCVLVPIALQFQPQLILVSAGFDAAAGDKGGCSVTPGGFAQMTRILQSICPKLVLVLEGGYELAIISECVCACVRTLLGDEIHLRTEARPKKEARLSIERTLRSHRAYWTGLNEADADVMSITAIALQIRAFSDEATEDSAIDCPHKQPKAASRRRRQQPSKVVTGVSIATRRAAEGNWRGDVKQLSRKEAALRGALEKIEVLKQAFQKGSKISRKDCELLEKEEELDWQLEEVVSELRELMSLSNGDVVRMYAGCQ